MTDRVSKIILRGDIRDFQAKMVAAGRSVSDFGDKITSQDKKGAQFRKGLTGVGDAAGKMGLVAAAGLGAAVVASARFDSAMSKVQAATHESVGNMEALRAAAIKAGADTAFSANEAADAITALSKAGVATKDILGGGLNGALSLAAAGELDVGQSAEIAATAMTQFGLSGKDIPHIADLLAAGAGKAQGEVTDMAQALKYVGPVAHQMGISIEQTSGTIAELASQGILADQAGTSLRGMLTSLTSPSKIATKTMESLGIELYNAQGNFVGFDGVAGQLQKTMSGLTNEERDQALGRIFGNEQITAARILYAGGAKDVDKWTKAVDDNGFAADTASIKMDNLAGDFERLKGSLSTLLIEGGDGSKGFLRGVVQGADGATNALNSLPGPAKNAALQLAAITAVTGGALWLGSRVVTSIANTRVALDQMTGSGIKAGAALRGLRNVGVAAIGLELVTAGASALGDAMLDSYPGVEQMTKALLGLKAARTTDDLAKEFDDVATSIERLTDPSLGEKAQNIAAHIVTFGQSSSFEIKGARKEIDALDAAFANLVSTGSPQVAAETLAEFGKATGLTADEQKQLAQLMPQYQEALAGVANQASLSGDATGEMTTATEGLTGATDTNTNSTDANTKSIETNIKAMQDAAKAANTAFDAETAFQRSLNEGKNRNKEKVALEKQITQAEKDGAKERADIQRRAAEAGADTSKDTLDIQRKLASARADLGSAKTDSARSSARDNIASLTGQLSDKQTGQGRAARDAQEQIQDSLDRQAKAVAALREQLKPYKDTLDKTTEAGQKNRDMMSEQAKAFNSLSNQQKNAPGRYEKIHQKLVDEAKQFGLTGKEVDRYIKKLGLEIPPRVQTKLDLEDAKAKAKLDAWKLAWDDLKPKTVKLFLKTVGSKVDHQLGEKGFADGGFTGAGGKFEPAGIVHRGEFVVDAEQTMRHRALLEAIHRRAPGYVNGGYVQQQRAQLRGYSSGGYVTGGLSSSDMAALVKALGSMRPVVGTQIIQPHNYNEFRRQQDANERLSSMGAESFRG